MKKCITILMATVLVAVAATRVYDVELSGNDNATTPRGPDNWVGQTFIATCDSIQWAAFFVGRSSRAEPNDKYYLGIYDSTGGGFPLGEVNIPVHSDSIYRFLRGNFNPAVKVTKGVKYMLKVWHSGGDSVNFYFNRDSASYHYGELWVNGQKTGYDLAARGISFFGLSGLFSFFS